MSKNKILITGATGNIGKELTKILLEKEIPFRTMVRDEKDGKAFENSKNVEAVIGDFDQPETVTAALQGVERAFLLTPSTEKAEMQQKNFVALAKAAGVKHLVKQSQWAANENSPVRFLRYHRAVEKEIEESGLDYTFLRPNLFMQNLLGFADSIKTDGKFYADAEDCRISIVDMRDIAEVAAAALTETGHENKIYNITGAEALTHAEMAEKLSAALGKKVEYINLPPQAMQQMMIKFGMPEWQARGLTEDFAHYRRGEAAEIADGVEKAIGKKPYLFAEFARGHRSIFLGE